MRNQFQDIIPSDKRSIRNIPIPERKEREDKSRIVRIKKAPKAETEEEILSNEKNEVLNLEVSKKKPVFRDDVPAKRGFSRTFLWGITLIAVVALFFSITSIFKSANLTVVEKSLAITLTGANIFLLNPGAGQAGYSTITITDSVEALVPATGEKQVSNKAVGTVVIYSATSESSQTLVAGTRIETPSGLIFKLDKTVVVPGITKSKTKNIPGSVEVSVTAEKPGADYNIDLSDFTIPGFKGTTKYNSFYGRSKGAMSGGNVGMIATIDDAARAATVTDLQNKLVQSIKEKVQKQLPTSQKTFDGFEKIIYTTSDPKLQGEGGNSKALIKVSASAKIYALDVNSFAKRLLFKSGGAASSTESFSIDMSDVKVSFESEASSTLTANLEGKAIVIWDVNVDAFRNAAAGKSLEQIPTIAKMFPEIDSVSVVIKPLSLWRPTLPKDAQKIHVRVEAAK